MYLGYSRGTETGMPVINLGSNVDFFFGAETTYLIEDVTFSDVHSIPNFLREGGGGVDVKK